MSITVVDSAQNGQDNSPPATLAVTLTGIQSGDCIVAFGVAEGSETIAMSDDKANSYVLEDAVLDRLHALGYPRVRLMYAVNVASGDTAVTMTLSASIYRWMAAAAFRGVKTVSPVPSGAYASAEGESTTPATGNITTSGSGAIVAAFGTIGPVPHSITEDGAYTVLEEHEGDPNYDSGSLIYRLVGAGTYNPSWTTENSRRWVAMGLALLEQPAGGTGPFITRSIARRV